MSAEQERIADLFVEPGSTLEAALRRIHELEAQVAALKEIAIEERARGNHYMVAYEEFAGFGGELGLWVYTDYMKAKARRQLAKEHPEAFR